MKKQPRQPNMDEWMLDSMHGLHDGDDEEDNQLTPSHFLNLVTYDYVRAIHPKRRPYWLERQIRLWISRSIWPRIVIARCRLILATSLPLLVEGHLELIENILTAVRSAMHYLGIILHSLRLLMNLASLLEPLFTDQSPLEGIKQQFDRSWFELFLDSHSLISAFIPSNYLITSCALSVLELGLFAFRGWNEQNRISSFKTLFGEQLKKEGLSEDCLIELKKSEAHATAMLHHTYKKLALNLVVLSSSILLFVFRHFIIPSVSLTLAVNPIVSFIFAILALTLSLANHYIGQYLDEEKPKVKMADLSGKSSTFKMRNNFFKVNAPVPAPDAENEFEFSAPSLEAPASRNSLTLCCL
ncbi:TPA: hypothetical protein F8R51_11560 [Legionella pneumophila]|nr:hypothetical protein [Legionella pneumophila]